MTLKVDIPYTLSPPVGMGGLYQNLITPPNLAMGFAPMHPPSDPYMQAFNATLARTPKKEDAEAGLDLGTALSFVAGLLSHPEDPNKGIAAGLSAGVPMYMQNRERAEKAKRLQEEQQNKDDQRRLENERYDKEQAYKIKRDTRKAEQRDRELDIKENFFGSKKEGTSNEALDFKRLSEVARVLTDARGFLSKQELYGALTPDQQQLARDLDRRLGEILPLIADRQTEALRGTKLSPKEIRAQAADAYKKGDWIRSKQLLEQLAQQDATAAQSPQYQKLMQELQSKVAE